MIATTKSLSLIEQKRLQWAKEKEEMVGLYGLWGKPRNASKSDTSQLSLHNKSNLLPPIEGNNELEEQTKEAYRLEEESETSGYLSDSPKHVNERGEPQSTGYSQTDEHLNNEENKQQYWSEVEKSENFWANRKMYKNYKNKNWAHQNTESYINQNSGQYQPNKNYWYGTPESASSDDGSRLRWGDRGVGIGHLWEPVINVPDCRLPQVSDPYRQTPKWVEKGLKNADGNKADILIIHHPDDEQQYNHSQKNYLLGQNAPIPPEVIEERERKRKKALEHQNAIKKQLEERELKRKQERENRLREERLEEERIKKEQEIERKRFEEEQRRLREKEELERKKEEAMREAIKEAERKAREEKRFKRQISNEIKNNLEVEKPEKFEKIIEPMESNLNNRKHLANTPRHRRGEGNNQKPKKEPNEKTLKDSSSQFEEIQLANNFQFLNVNGLPVDGGLALMLDNPSKDNNFLLPPDGVQLALLMSPRNAGTTNCLIPPSPLIPNVNNTGERVLTPSKYRLSGRRRFYPSNKSTQTDFKTSLWAKQNGLGMKSRKQNRNVVNSGSSGGSQKRSAVERHHKHVRYLNGPKHLKQSPRKINLEERPKWGINRPSVQYKKQSEKDPYYQKKVKERLKKALEVKNVTTLSKERVEEKELKSIATFVDCPSDEENVKDVLLNGYRMNSNLSSPVFVPIGKRLESDNKPEIETERSESKESGSGENEELEEEEEVEEEEDDDDDDDEDEDTVVPGSVGFLTQTQLEAIKQIANLREGLKKLQKDYSNSRSITPFSDISVEK